MRSEAELRAAAKASGLTVEHVELVPAADGSGDRVMVAKMSFSDPWAAARYLVRAAKEDATDPVVRAYAFAILDAVARSRGEDASGPTMSPGLKVAFTRAIVANVQAQIRFRRERKETFQSARETLRLRAGDCDDHARLVMALALAAGVPARLVFFQVDGEPVHVVAIVKPTRTWRWAETTIGARFGEHPYAAYRRIGPDPTDDPMSQDDGTGRARGGMGSPWIRFVTGTDAQNRKVAVNAVVESVNADVAACAGLDAGTRTAWTQFYQAWGDFMADTPSWYNAAAQYDQADSYAQTLHDMQTSLAGKSCVLSAPQVDTDAPPGGEMLSTVKWIAGAVAIVAVAAGVRAVADRA